MAGEMAHFPVLLKIEGRKELFSIEGHEVHPEPAGNDTSGETLPVVSHVIICLSKAQDLEHITEEKTQYKKKIN